MLAVIDNYDSFTYNLVHYFENLDVEVFVFKNDAITLNELIHLNPQYLVISPGPNDPNQSGVSLEVIQHFYDKIPILGVCLGHQAIAQVFGGKVIQSAHILHGKTSHIIHNKKRLFQHIPTPFRATRYHSLMIDCHSLSMDFTIDAWSEDGVIMAISHHTFPLFGIQYHPEAILTEHGYTLLKEFLRSGV